MKPNKLIFSSTIQNLIKSYAVFSQIRVKVFFFCSFLCFAGNGQIKVSQADGHTSTLRQEISFLLRKQKFFDLGFFSFAQTCESRRLKLRFLFLHDQTITCGCFESGDVEESSS